MTQPIYLLNTRTRLTWSPVLEPLEWESEPVELPLLGDVSAGEPIAAVAQQETVTVPRCMARNHSFALRVRGHSMVDDQIQDGDIILVERRQRAENGETVVALIDGDQVTLKRFYREAQGIRLQPANPGMAPIALRPEQIQILGVVSGLVRRSP